MMAAMKKNWVRVLLSILMTVFFLAGCVLLYDFYDSHVDRSGWILHHDQYYYRDFHNHNVTGWQSIEGVFHYFNEEGVMQTGWLDLDGARYFLKSDGSMAVGWLNHDGNRYYFDDDGSMHRGILEEGGKYFLLSEDGHLLTGMQSHGSDTYYLLSDGSAAIGPMEIQGKNYCFGADGKMQHGWADLADGLHYFLEDGTMAYGFQEIDGKTYYFELDTGLPHYGWLQDEEYHYYFSEDGSALVGPQTLDGKQYYFTPKGIRVLLVNASNPLPEDYDPDLRTLTGWHQISSIAFASMKQMLTECKLAGKEPEINSIYRSGKNQALIMKERTEYFMENGMTAEDAAAKAATIVAAPGTSEHETGLSADLVGEEAKKWLAEHCWEYGFILRYPPEKADITGITFEPWHFRYVGKRVSMDMKDSGLCLEEYLGAGPAKPAD